MRAILVLLIGCALISGCKHPKGGATAGTNGATTGLADKKKATAREGRTQATPINESAGKVASVNTSLRFVVIDFASTPLPQVDQKLSVFRQGQKVGEVKISAQARNSIMAADLTAGEASVGDEVRPD